MATYNIKVTKDETHKSQRIYFANLFLQGKKNLCVLKKWFEAIDVNLSHQY